MTTEEPTPGRPSRYELAVVAPGLHQLRQALSGTVAVIAVIVLVGGWGLGIDSLKNVIPGAVGLKAWTAIGLLLCALALEGLSSPVPPALRSLARLAAAATALLGAVVGAEYLLSWDAGIDELLVRDRVGRAMNIAYPGRFAPTTAVCFVLLGLALLRIDARPRRGWRIAELLAVPVLGVAFLSVVGYLYSISAFYGPGAATKIAINTSVCFLALGAGVLIARPRGALVALMTTRDPGGILVRRLAPIAVVGPCSWAGCA